MGVHFFICLLIPAQQIRMAIFDLATAAIITALAHTVCTVRLMGPVSRHAAGRACCHGMNKVRRRASANRAAAHDGRDSQS